MIISSKVFMNKHFKLLLIIIFIIFFISCNKQDTTDTVKVDVEEIYSEELEIDLNELNTNENENDYTIDINNENKDVIDNHTRTDYSDYQKNEDISSSNNKIDDNIGSQNSIIKNKSYPTSIENYIKNKASFDEILFSKTIPDFIKNIFFDDAFTFFITTKIDETYGRFAIDNYKIVQPSRLSISSSLKEMIENSNLSKEEIENNIYKGVSFPDLLICPQLISNKTPIEIAKILYALNLILTKKIVSDSFREYYSYKIYKKYYNNVKSYNDITDVEGIDVEELEYMELDNEILQKIIESIIENIEFFKTYTNYDFYNILNHPYISPIMTRALINLIKEDPLKINPALFLRLKIEENIKQNKDLQDIIIYQINNGSLFKILTETTNIGSKYIRSLLITAILYNYIYNIYNKPIVSNVSQIVNYVNTINFTSPTISEIINLCCEILSSPFPKSYITTDRLIRIFHKYHLSGGISGLSYGSVSWVYGDKLTMYLLSGDYKVYEMPMDTMELYIIDNIYEYTVKEDIFLPILEFEYSRDKNISLISVARPTYVNSYLFDFKYYEYKEVTKFFKKTVFTSKAYMDRRKIKIIAQSLNAENEKDDLIQIDLTSFSVESLLSDCKIKTLEISPDGNKLLITGNLDQKSDSEIVKPYIYNVRTKEFVTLPLATNLSSFSWDITEDLVYYVVENKNVYSYDIYKNIKKKILTTDLFIYNLAAGIDMFAFSYLLQDTGEHRLYLYDTRTKTNILVDTVQNMSIRPGFSPDGKYLLYEVVNNEYKDLYLLRVR